MSLAMPLSLSPLWVYLPAFIFFYFGLFLPTFDFFLSVFFRTLPVSTYPFVYVLICTHLCTHHQA